MLGSNSNWATPRGGTLLEWLQIFYMDMAFWNWGSRLWDVIASSPDEPDSPVCCWRRQTPRSKYEASCVNLPNQTNQRTYLSKMLPATFCDQNRKRRGKNNYSRSFKKAYVTRSCSCLCCARTLDALIKILVNLFDQDLASNINKAWQEQLFNHLKYK